MIEVITIPNCAVLRAGLMLGVYEVTRVIFPTRKNPYTHLTLCAGADLFEAKVPVGANRADVNSVVQI